MPRSHSLKYPIDRLGPRTRWHRAPEFIYYLTWLRRARKAVQGLACRPSISMLSVHATFSAFWLPTPAVSLGDPQRVGSGRWSGDHTAPAAQAAGASGMAQELLDYASVRDSWRRSRRPDALLCEPPSESSRIGKPERCCPHWPETGHASSTMRCSASFPTSRLRKMVDMHCGCHRWNHERAPTRPRGAGADTPGDIRLKMVGDGPQRKHLEQPRRNSASPIGSPSPAGFPAKKRSG